MIDPTLVLKDGVWYDVNGRPQNQLIDGAKVSVTLAASGQVVAAQGAGLKIRVYGYVISALAATAVKFQTGSGGDISPTFSLAATSGFVVPQASDPGWFETLANEALNLNMSVNTTVGVGVIYAVVK